MELFISLEFVKSINGFVGTFTGDRHYPLPLDKEEIPFILSDLMSVIHKFKTGLIIDFSVGEPYSVEEERSLYCRLASDYTGEFRLIEWQDSHKSMGEDKGKIPADRRSIRKILGSVLERAYS